MVRNTQGEFEALASDASVLALDESPSVARGRTPLQFRVETSRSAPAALAIPVEYRITVGASDQIAVWTVPAVIRVGADR